MQDHLRDTNSSSDRIALGAVIGLIAGVVATGPMTVAMALWHRRLPMSERYPLPPREITMKLARDAGVSRELSPDMRSAATLLAHFGYGGAAGTLYKLISDKVPAPPIAKGVAFGLLVWGASYLGLLPGAGILKVATRHPARRNALMIGAHVVWGAVTGAVAELLTEEARGRGPQPFSSTTAAHHDV
jgi:uncharacterized membrane protein YagU involved in acid resistance